MPEVLVELFVRHPCVACDDARVVVATVCADLGVRWAESDVDADRESYFEYGDRVPVLLVDGVERACWGVDEQTLRAALDTIDDPRRSGKRSQSCVGTEPESLWVPKQVL